MTLEMTPEEKLEQELKGFDTDLVKVVMQVIVKEDEVESILNSKKIKEIISRKGYEEKDIPAILEVFFKNGVIETPLEIKGEQLTSKNEFEFLFNFKKVNVLNSIGLL